MQYEGFGTSESMVMGKIFSDRGTLDQDGTDAKKCNFDIVLGHSQGAILTAALLSIHDKLRSGSEGPLGYILNGVAWPNPYDNKLRSLADQARRSEEESSSSPRMLFVMGEMDNVNPIESAMQVHGAYDAARFNVSIVSHGGGHSVPIGRDEDSARALEEVANWIIGIAKEKRRRLMTAS